MCHVMYGNKKEGNVYKKKKDVKRIVSNIKIGF